MADNGCEHSFANWMRRRRFARFLSFIGHLPRPVRILDVGGTEMFWRHMRYTEASEIQVVLANVRHEPTTLSNFRSVISNACALNEFGDGSFDVVFSNSVIEHVGSFEEQSKMARELQRVGRLFFLQTPARSFPIEPHFLVPGFQFLPRRWQSHLVRRFSLGWFPRFSDPKEIDSFLSCFRLMTFGELRQLFPAAIIDCEKFAGLTKSYLVCGVGHYRP